ncbi:ABC-F type ribosomal protection protein [Clostridiaceae bacterium M8S5]|nr:ABC-F type ribosomal protection protein [Clostridiaceae bacterium M8S5]
MIELSLQNVSKSYGATKVLEDISFEVHSKDRIGMVGKNGTGKTTILKILAEIEEYNGGNISMSKGTKIGYLDQIPNYPENYVVMDVLNLAFEDVINIKAQMQQLEKKMCDPQDDLDKIMNKYSDLQTKYEHLGGYDVEEKLSKVCIGLKIDDKFRVRKFNELSGGEKTTVILAKILLENPNILLLDEPTNHLDIQSIEWLEEYIKEYDGCVIIISHDRYFLDRAVNKIIDIEEGKAIVYKGNYTYFINEKEAKRQLQLDSYKVQQRKIKSMEEAAKRFRDWANRADNESMYKKAKNMERRIEKMEKIEKPKEYKKADIKFTSHKKSSKDIARIENLSMSFEDKKIFNNADLIIRANEKIAILGKNGCGKSTLFRLILGKLKPNSGVITTGSGVKFGYLEQEIKFEQSEKTVLQYIREELILNEYDARHLLVKYNFYKDDVYKKISVLSGGEKVRLKLCIMLMNKVNTLILDEPTNHLDIDSREMLEEALKEFKGTIIFISHDRYFINKMASRIAEINRKKIIVYEGSYDYYLEKKKDHKEEVSKKVKVKKVINTKPNNDNLEKDNSKKIQKLEEEIAKKETIIGSLKQELLKYPSDYEKLSDIQNEIEKVQKQIEELLEEWLQLS